MNSEENNAQAMAAPSSPAKAVKEEVAKTSNPDESNAEGQNMDTIVRIAKDSYTRNLISFVMHRLERGGKVTL